MGEAEVADKGDNSDACDGEDWVELLNPSDASASLSGLILADDKGPTYGDALPLGAAGCPLSLGAGELLLLCKDGAAVAGGATFAGCGFGFGIGFG